MTSSYLSAPASDDASSFLLRIAVGAALAGAGLVHVLLASTYAQSSLIVGAAFVVGAVSAFAAAVWLLLTDASAAWDLAFAVSAGMLVALAVSATIGLFGIRTATIGASEAVSIATESFVVIAWMGTRFRRR